MSTITPNLAPFGQPLADAPGQISLDEFLRIADKDAGRFELVDGRLVEKPVSDYSDLVTHNLKDELVVWAGPRDAGRSFVETAFRCFPHEPDRVRRPDVAFIAAARLAAYEWGQSTMTIVPDLVAEVLSPNERAFEIDDKVSDYLRAGVQRVLVLNPKARLIRIHRAPGALSEIAGDESELTDDEILPGFRCPLWKLFAKPGQIAPVK